jgi:hypothetical protein
LDKDWDDFCCYVRRELLCCFFAFFSPFLEWLVAALPLIPAMLLIAVINAFNEEFTLQAAPVSELSMVIGKQQTLEKTSLFFGIGIFYGVPSGPLGFLLATFLGWFLSKSMRKQKVSHGLG